MRLMIIALMSFLTAFSSPDVRAGEAPLAGKPETGFDAEEKAEIQALRQTSQTFRAVAGRVRPAVVHIRCLLPSRQYESTPNDASASEEHRENMDRIMEDMHKYRTQQRKQLQQGADVDEKSLENLLNQGSEMWKEKERERIRYRQQISTLLTQEQNDRLYMCKSSRPKPRWEKRQGRPPIPPPLEE